MFLAVTESPLTTISFWRPLKNSKFLTTSKSAVDIAENEETTINYITLIESWSCILCRRRGYLSAANRIGKRKHGTSVGLLLTHRRIARQIVWRWTPVPSRDQIAIFAADIPRQALQLSPVIIPDDTFTSYEGRFVADERYDTVRIEEIGTRGFL